jgi:hypothetical protein
MSVVVDLGLDGRLIREWHATGLRARLRSGSQCSLGNGGRFASRLEQPELGAAILSKCLGVLGGWIMLRFDPRVTGADRLSAHSRTLFDLRARPSIWESLAGRLSPSGPSAGTELRWCYQINRPLQTQLGERESLHITAPVSAGFASGLHRPLSSQAPSGPMPR